MTDPQPAAARGFAGRVASRRGWRLNPDQAHLAGVLSGLESNRQRYGYYLCPCRDGAGVRAQDADIACPCSYAEADVADHGHCYCGLFLAPRFAQAGRAVEPIPERRPLEREAAAPPTVSRDLCSIRDIVRGINQLERDLKRLHGLTLNEGLCLCCVTNLGRTPGDCARQIGLSPSQISRILNSLEKKGLLERRSLPDDHRSTDLAVTQKGQQCLLDLRSSAFAFSRLDARAAGLGREPAG